jgi:sporulation protein YlmC with PRC-barrel domain
MALERLSKLADWELADSSQDIRGVPLFDEHGAQMGIVEDMVVDTDKQLVTWVVLDDGRRVEAAGVRIEPDAAHIDPSEKSGHRQRPPLV